MPTILVTGASGRVGRATLKAVASHGDVTVKAAAKSHGLSKLSEFKMVELVEADGLEPTDVLKNAFAGVDTAIIIIPSEGRSIITHILVAEAKAARVKHAVVLSARIAGTAGYTTTRFGRQFRMVEEAWKESGINYTILRLPFFLENEYANVESIKNNGTVQYPVASDRPWTYISVADIGAAFAAVATNPERHVNQTYALNGPDAITCQQLVQYYSEALRKEIKFIQGSDWNAVRKLCRVGLPAWKAEGLVEMWHIIDEGAPEMSHVYDDFERIVGRKGTSAKEWIEQMLPAFK